MSSFFSRLAEGITNVAGESLFNHAASIINAITPIFLIGFSLYLLLVVANYLSRGFDGSVIDFTKNFTGWIIIIALSLNYNNYTALAKILYNLPDELASLFTHGEIMSSSIVDAQIEAVKAAKAKINVMQNAVSGWAVGSQISLLIAEGAILFLGLLTILIAFVVHFLVKLTLALILVVGPIFLASMLFSSTRQYGMNWIGQVLNYSISMGLYSLIISFHVKYLNIALNIELKEETNWYGFGTKVVIDTGLIGEMVFNLTIISLVFIPILLSVPSIASALTGGAGLNITPRGIVNSAKGAKNVGKAVGSRVKGLFGNSIRPG